MQELTIFVEAGGIGAEQIDVRWQEEVDSIPDPAREMIDRRWAEYEAVAKERGSSLFNGGITWLVGAMGENGRVTLHLAPGQYKDFVVTVLRDRPWFTAHAPAAMRPALGNSVLLTSGDTALLGVRSPRVSAYAGRAHLIGGVLDRLGTPELPPTADGILKHLRREMNEEANITDSEIAAAPRLIAVARDEALGQPELIWQCEVNVDLRRIAERIDAEEHESCVILAKANIEPETWARMTPVARAAWERWSGAR